MKVLANLVVDHQRAKALRVGEVTPPVLFYVSMLSCGHWQLQRADDGRGPNPAFAHEGHELPCQRCEAEVGAEELTGAFAALVRRGAKP
jgi:hypothetical protein